MNVFISHAFTDTKLAERVTSTLREAGFHVWGIDRVLPGDNWAESLYKAIDESDSMLVLLTPNSVHSRHVESEISYALGKRKYKGRLIPVLAAPAESFEAGEIPWVFNLQQFQMISAPNLEKDEDSLQKITQALQALA
jgi:hypothetical protein